jgi:hypothetical protein
MNLKLFKLKMINIFLLDNKAIYNISWFWIERLYQKNKYAIFSKTTSLYI